LIGDHVSVGVAIGDSVVRKRTTEAENPDDLHNSKNVSDSTVTHKVSWRRVLLLIVAITIHNIPG
jgi:zinc transporter ZupT